jgi:hypothetical protein
MYEFEVVVAKLWLVKTVCNADCSRGSVPRLARRRRAHATPQCALKNLEQSVMTIWGTFQGLLMGCNDAHSNVKFPRGT